MIIVIIVQVNALLETLDLTESAQHKGHFSLYNCLILGHTKYNGVQRVTSIRSLRTTLRQPPIEPRYDSASRY
jgi:hypothetical protein